MLFAQAITLVAATLGAAQTPPQQYVYGSTPATTTTSQVVGYSKSTQAGQTGSLTSVPGSPFSDKFQGGAMTIDGQGRFLFVLNPSTSNISMFQLDQSTGSLTEVPASPFSATATETNLAPRSPICLAADKSGQFLYVGYQFGNLQGQGAVNQFLIDVTNPANPQLLTPAATSTTDIRSSPIGILIDPNGPYLYVALGLNLATGFQDAGNIAYQIDTVTGQLAAPVGLAGNAQSEGRTAAIDPQGRFFFDGWGGVRTFIDSAPIDPATGTATTGVLTIELPSGDAPLAMLTDATGKFLYVQQAASHVYLVDQTTGALTQTASALSVLNFTPGSAVSDPLGPYLYSLQRDGVHAFVVDSQSGALSEIPGSPFSTGSNAQGTLTISGAPAQAVSGPVAALFPASQNFGTITLGQSSSAQTATLTNTGGQGLSLNSITVSGTNATDFAATPNCSIPTVLSPNGTCSITVVFTPSATGPRQANLTATDNAPASPQSIPLTGTGVAPQPGVTLMPGSLSFPSTNQGSTSPAQTVTLTNAGNATLHISSVLLSGANPGDFRIANSCNGAYAINANCTIAVSFAPLAGGQRTASIVITDDAPDSPQSVPLSGSGIGTPVTKPAVTLTPASVSFGTVTQGVTSGPQNVMLTSSGTATLHISSVVLGGVNSSDLSMANSCAPGAYAVNSTCTISLTFAPLATGPHTATVTITDDAPDSPQIIPITASVNPAFTATPASSGANSVTVSPGQTAMFNLQLTPGPGFAGSVSFTCSGAPIASTCTAPPVQLSGNPLPYTVSVATTGSAVMTPVFNKPAPERWITLRLIFLLALCVVLLVAFSRKSLGPRALRPRLIYAATFSILISATIFGAGGCGGAGATLATPNIQTPPPVTTPQGTSTIIVTPTATTSSGKQLPAMPPIQLTLTVS